MDPPHRDGSASNARALPPHPERRRGAPDDPVRPLSFGRRNGQARTLRPLGHARREQWLGIRARSGASARDRPKGCPRSTSVPAFASGALTDPSSTHYLIRNSRSLPAPPAGAERLLQLGSDVSERAPHCPPGASALRSRRVSPARSCLLGPHLARSRSAACIGGDGSKRTRRWLARRGLELDPRGSAGPCAVGKA